LGGFRGVCGEGGELLRRKKRIAHRRNRRGFSRGGLLLHLLGGGCLKIQGKIGFMGREEKRRGMKGKEISKPIVVDQRKGENKKRGTRSRISNWMIMTPGKDCSFVREKGKEGR